MASSIPEEKKPLIIVITGPTGVGKTEIAFKLAENLSSAEIISCDSMAVYTEMNIGVSKPSPEMREKIPHHLIDICSVKDEFNVAEYVKLAKACVEDIVARGKIPIIVGGSLLYLYSLLDGIFLGPGRDKRLREKLISIAKNKGLDYLYAKLKEIDPQSADKIHPNDLRRIIRALEVWLITGEKISKLQRIRSGIYDKYNVKILALIRDRKKIYQNIDLRVERMVSQGLIDEVYRLWQKGLGLTAYQGHGYKEIIGHFEGRYSQEEAIRLTKRNTRRYAKRQISWLRRDKRIRWINLDDFKSGDEVVNYIMKELEIVS